MFMRDSEDACLKGPLHAPRGASHDSAWPAHFPQLARRSAPPGFRQFSASPAAWNISRIMRGAWFRTWSSQDTFDLFTK